MGQFINNSRLWFSKKTTANQYKTAKLFFPSCVAIWKKRNYLKMQSPKALHNATRQTNEHKHDCCATKDVARPLLMYSFISRFKFKDFGTSVKSLLVLANMATLSPTLSFSHHCHGWVLCGVRVVKNSLLGLLLLN